jgi:hypothetical protein
MRNLIAVLVAAAMAAAACGDEITLQSGQVVVGRIVKQTSANITIETMVGGKPATLTFPRTQVRSVVRGAVPDSFFEPAAPATPAAPASPAAAGGPGAAGGAAGEGHERGEAGASSVGSDGELDEGDDSLELVPGDPASNAVRYLAVPLKGAVGQEITARGVRDAIRLARRARVQVVVFVIETDGGRVADAEAIVRVMEEERGELQYISVVSRALSAGIWPLSRSDHIFFEPGATAGAATAYSVSTGSIAVDAKLNAALAARLASAAESRGQSGCVYRAMVLMEATLHQWRDGDGRVHVSGKAPPAGAIDPVEVVAASAVLALTSKQAAAIGFGVELPSKDLGAIGGLIGAPRWESAGTVGGGPMRAAQREIERRQKEVADAERRLIEAREQVIELARLVPKLASAADKADPGRITVYYREGSGVLTAESQLRWRQQTDEAVARWNDVLAGLSRLKSAERSAERALDQFNAALVREAETRLYSEMPEPLELAPVNHGLDIATLQREAEKKKESLLARRVRTNVGK